jgi:hypothetical protein
MRLRIQDLHSLIEAEEIVDQVCPNYVVKYDL